MANEWLPELEPLEEGHVAVAVVAVVQAITPEGYTTYYVRGTHGLDDMTSIGMLDSALQTQRNDIQRRWEGD